MYRHYHNVGFFKTEKSPKDQIIQTNRRLRTAISTDGNTPTPQTTDLSLEHWPRRSPPIRLQTPTQVPSGTTDERGFSQADGHEILCWLG